MIIQNDAPPIRTDAHGVVRVGKSQVLLDVLIREHESGASPESIALACPTLCLADVYGAIAYYLRHKEEVEAYLRRRDQEAAELWQQIETTQPSNADLKAQIRDRWSKRGVALS